MVRSGVVTGMPSFVVASIASARWIRRPGRARPPAPGTLTSTRVAAVGRRSQSAAADAWLSAAPGPQASTAAIQRPRPLSSGWPTA